MSTSETPLAVVNKPSARQLTQAEVQHFINDSWKALDMRLAPGRLDPASYARLSQHVQANHLDLLKQAYSLIFTNYQEAVRISAEALHQSVRALIFEPLSATQKTFDPLALRWLVEHPVIAQRRTRDIENKGLAPIDPASVPNYAEREKEAADKAAAQKEHDKAVKDIERAIDNIVFQNFRGYDNAEMEKVKADLRAYVGKNLGKHNGVKILRIVRESIAGAHQAYERRQQAWNNR